MPKVKQKSEATLPIKVIVGKSKPAVNKVIIEPTSTTSKQQLVLNLLTRPIGATLEEMMAASGWQRNSVRGLLSGVVKKRLRLPLASAAEERGRVYRVGAGC